MRFLKQLFCLQRENKIAKEKSSYKMLVSSIVSIFVCAACLCGASWAWFTATAAAGVGEIATAKYEWTYQVEATEPDASGNSTDAGTEAVTDEEGGTAADGSETTGETDGTDGTDGNAAEQIVLNDATSNMSKTAAPGLVAGNMSTQSEIQLNEVPNNNIELDEVTPSEGSNALNENNQLELEQSVAQNNNTDSNSETTKGSTETEENTETTTTESKEFSGDNAEITVKAGGTYKITLTLKANGKVGAHGYCEIKIGDATYRTEVLTLSNASEGATFTFTVYAEKDGTITLTPKWGSYTTTETESTTAGYTVIENNKEIGKKPAEAGSESSSTNEEGSQTDGTTI